MGGALLVMVANLTAGRKRFAAVEDSVLGVRTRAEALRDRALQLVDDDIAAYQRVADAMSLPRGDDDERARRRAAMQEALKGAAGPPLETMRAAAEVLQLAASMVRIGNPSAVSDVGTAAASARAGFEAARLNVEINLAAIDDDIWRKETREILETLTGVEQLERDVLAATEDVIRGRA
jgi:formiminotetrahydrofolate cyclodeaminase